MKDQKPVPPSLAEFAIGERAELLATIARYETTAENCDLLRATVNEQAREIERLRMQLSACGVVALANTPESAANARDMHPDYMSASCGDVIRTVDIQMQLRAELAALKAQPSGVVQWPEADEIMQMAFEEGQPSEDASGYYFELEEFDLFIQRLMEEVARLNSSPVIAGEYGDAYQGAREDLAIWKRRALEAETKVREQDQIIDHLTLEAQGEARFGEPVFSAGGVDERE